MWCSRLQRRLISVAPLLVKSRQVSSTANNANLIDQSLGILNSRDPVFKAKATQDLWLKWQSGTLPRGTLSSVDSLANHPGQPEKPQLFSIKEMPTPKQIGVSMSEYLLHGLAHIEFNAMNLYLDTIVRFSNNGLPDEFLNDMLEIAADEARHFTLVCTRLAEIDSFYGAIPAHKALWENALNTKDDLEGRIAIVPLVQEARGLDAGPRLISKLRAEKDRRSADIVTIICEEERRHVRYGLKWFQWLCRRKDLDPVVHFHRLVRQYMKAGLPRPFNVEARAQAGMDETWYLPVEMDKLRAESNLG